MTLGIGENSLDEKVSEATSGMLGYSHNNGGLTNQKLALLGLFVDAFETKSPILLPKMTVKDHVVDADALVSIGDVFDLESLTDFLNKYAITILEERPDDLGSGPSWAYFGKGASKCSQLAVGHVQDPVLRNLISEFFQCLTPLLKHSYILKHLKEDVFTKSGVGAVAQFRIESDWEWHSACNLKPTISEPEDYLLTYDLIVAKIVRTLPHIKKILVLCDESAISISKSLMADTCRSRFGVELFWKSDFLTRFELSKLNNLELSMIDFELALCGSHYVGLSRSTFSNVVTSTKYFLTGEQVTSDYIYNNNSLLLSRRNDNGAGHVPSDVIKVR